MPETEPTPWELMRVLRDIREDVRSMKTDMITRDEWSASVQSIDRRFLEVDRRQDEWKRESQAAHVDIEAQAKEDKVAAAAAVAEVRAEVQQVRKEVRDAADKQRTQRSTLWIGVGLAVLAAILPRVVELFIGGPL